MITSGDFVIAIQTKAYKTKNIPSICCIGTIKAAEKKTSCVTGRAAETKT